MDESNPDEQPKVARAGRRARQAQLMQSEQVVDSQADERQSAPHEATEEPQAAPAQGIAAFASRDEQQSDSTATQPQASNDTQPSPQPPAGAPPPGERRGGFMDAPAAAQLDPFADDTGKKLTGVSRRKQEQQIQEQENLAKARNKYEERVQDAAVNEIPELEEEGKEDLTRVVAAAPKVRAHKIQGMEELDEDQQYRLPTMQDQDMDLSSLTAVLCSSERVYEPDEIWDPELLLSQVAAECNAHKDTGLEPRESFPDPLAYQA